MRPQLPEPSSAVRPLSASQGCLQEPAPAEQTDGVARLTQPKSRSRSRGPSVPSTEFVIDPKADSPLDDPSALRRLLRTTLPCGGDPMGDLAQTLRPVEYDLDFLIDPVEVKYDREDRMPQWSRADFLQVLGNAYWLSVVP